jgi:hypothetical protein
VECSAQTIDRRSNSLRVIERLDGRLTELDGVSWPRWGPPALAQVSFPT